MKCETKFEFESKRKSIWYHMLCAFSNNYVLFTDLRKMEGLKLSPLAQDFVWNRDQCKECEKMDDAYFLIEYEFEEKDKNDKVILDKDGKPKK